MTQPFCTVLMVEKFKYFQEVIAIFIWKFKMSPAYSFSFGMCLMNCIQSYQSPYSLWNTVGIIQKTNPNLLVSKQPLHKVDVHSALKKVITMPLKWHELLTRTKQQHGTMKEYMLKTISVLVKRTSPPLNQLFHELVVISNPLSKQTPTWVAIFP